MGRIFSSEFVPIAESDTTAADALTEWMLGATVEAYQALVHSPYLCRSLSIYQMHNLHGLTLPDRLEQRLRAEGCRPTTFVLSLPKAQTDCERSSDILSYLRLKGI